MDPTCMYCAENEALKELMLPVCDLGVTKLYLFKNQSYPGRCLVALNEHVNEFHDMTDAQAAQFALDVKRAAVAVKAAFSPVKVNLGMYNDKGGHLHCHIVPKYEGGMSFGAVFEMNPAPGVYLSEAEYAKVISDIKARL